MKYSISVILLLFSAYSFAEFNYSSYQTETVEKAITNMGIDPEADYFIEAGNFKYNSLVKYTGSHRTTIPETQDFIDKWVKAMGHPIAYTELFTFEVEFEQNGILYWLPIQSTLVEPFAAEVSPQGNVILYIMAAGAVNQKPIFLINEFQTQ